MGVPAFFRWLSRKYPSIIVSCTEEKAKECNGIKIPVDTSKPNPNEVEFDNLYLDMNGIIHPCTHPEDKPAPKNEDEMMVAIFEYIDRLFNIVRPRRLLYMAIDGVAPRAKMNQQRSRRFRASKEGMETAEEKQRIREEILGKGGFLPPEEVKERFDSNCITPGTEFMDNLAKCLRYYIADRLNNDPGWKNVTVILSDASAPGEGEHKIMDYIRRQRAQPNHDPNTHHCLCGADADLIMLGLATHEPNFTIIREEFKPNKPKPCGLCNQFGHEIKDCQGLPKEKQGEHDQFADCPPGMEQEFIFIRLCVLREYLERELTMASLPFTFDVERSIDDWVFMCFFVGNDFLPHLPSLEIREGAIDRLVNIYKNVVHKTGGYLTENGYVNLQRVQMIMLAVGEVEDSIFKKRKDDEENFKRRQKEKKKRMKREQHSMLGGQFAPQPLGRGNRSSHQPISNPRQAIFEMRMQDRQNTTPSASPNTSFTSDDSPSPAGGIKRKAEDSDSEPEPDDNIRLWEAGWKQRYYKNKFDVDASDKKFRYKVVQAYVEGLCWVLRYYYQGCASWKWYYPFHYAPFASDFEGITDMLSDFEKGTKPFKPLEQLMGVFPAASGNFLPPTWRKLMTDPESSIIDFYPEDFAIDLNGKKYAWQGVALLPFVDERRLRAALAEVYPDLTPEENRRNSLGGDVLFIGKHHQLHDFVLEQYKTSEKEPVDIPPELCHGIQGKLALNENPVLPDETVQSPVPQLRDLTQNSAISVSFKDPQYPEDYIFKAVVLSGAKKPPAVLKPGDWEKTNNDGRPWRPQLGFNRNRRQVHLDQSAFRTLGHSMPRDRGQSGSGVYSNIAPHGAYNQGNAYRPLLGRPQQQIPKLLSNLRPQDSWNGPTPLFQQPPQRFDRNSGATPLLAWNRMPHSQGPSYQQNQYQAPGGPMNYPHRPSDRRDRGRQGYGRPYPLPPSSGRYNWN
ncbi:5'-3' exoribonuclease 2 [Varanus komodoensis]|uniref:5'-3' exoribonuclease 2 n=1 Tax=Varanus komodoensis TaxID=61221 RepID=UPI001CF7A6E3|nr:5'-3' exoribonuclease 2 [Varanus komodoensis]